MEFDPRAYGPGVASLLELAGAGRRRMPLVSGVCTPAEAARVLESADTRVLFPKARSPRGALAGLWVYFSDFHRAHVIAQSMPDADGSYWHAIVHRQEPDAWNSRYWFNRVGGHPVFEPLAARAAALVRAEPNAGFRPATTWDPSRFIDFCEEARQRPGSAAERLALEIQRAEWELLLDWCAREARA